MALNARKQRFVAEYLKNPNATESARKAGYSAKTAYSQGHRLVHEPAVAEAIREAQDRRAKRLEISADRMLLNLARIANFDLLTAVSFDGNAVTLKNSDLLDDDDRYAIVEVKRGRDGISVKAADKLSAIKVLMEHLGMRKASDPVDDPAAKARELLEMVREMEATVPGDVDSADAKVDSA